MCGGIASWQGLSCGSDRPEAAFRRAPYRTLLDPDNRCMNPWKNVLASLSDAGHFLAHWHLHSGVACYMYVPRRLDIGEETIRAGSDVRFEEIARLDIMCSLRLGGLDASNDIDACRRAAASIGEVAVEEVEGGIQLSLRGADVR